MSLERYSIGKKIGKGSFGIVYQGQDLLTGQDIALKIERKNKKNILGQANRLQIEYNIYQKLHQNSLKSSYWPQVLHLGETPHYHYLVMEKKGPTLHHLFRHMSKQFTIRTVMGIAYQCLTILQSLHQHGIIHRDLKPDNWVIGLHDPHHIYLIDFGLAKSYQLPDGSHLPSQKRRKFVGSLKYASIPNQLCRESSRRDDLESLSYMFIYFLQGSLPWEKLPILNRLEKTQAVLSHKRQFTSTIHFERLPSFFHTFHRYCRQLTFDQSPDYSQLLSLFESIGKDTDLDWAIQSQPDSESDWSVISSTFSHSDDRGQSLEGNHGGI